MADLDAVVAYVAKLPACDGKVAVCGFCWGGGQSFSFATNNKSIKAAYVFYGTGPTDEAAIRRLEAPVYGFYGGNDARVTATTSRSAELMKAAGKTYEPVVYEGAGHGFNCDERGSYDAASAKTALDRTMSFIAEYVGK